MFSVNATPLLVYTKFLIESISFVYLTEKIFSMRTYYLQVGVVLTI